MFEVEYIHMGPESVQRHVSGGFLRKLLSQIVALIQLQTPRKLPEVAVMSGDIKLHCEALSVCDQVTQQLLFLHILGIETTSQTAED